MQINFSTPVGVNLSPLSISMPKGGSLLGSIGVQKLVASLLFVLGISGLAVLVSLKWSREADEASKQMAVVPDSGQEEYTTQEDDILALQLQQQAAPNEQEEADKIEQFLRKLQENV